MTKAEKIFTDTRFECRQHIKTWGYEENVGFNRLTTEDLISIRTCNDVQKIIDSKRHGIQIDRKLNVSTPEKLDEEESIINMVQITLSNSRKNIEKFNEELKTI